MDRMKKYPKVNIFSRFYRPNNWLSATENFERFVSYLKYAWHLYLGRKITAVSKIYYSCNEKCSRLCRLCLTLEPKQLGCSFRDSCLETAKKTEQIISLAAQVCKGSCGRMWANK